AICPSGGAHSAVMTTPHIAGSVDGLHSFVEVVAVAAYRAAGGSFGPPPPPTPRAPSAAPPIPSGSRRPAPRGARTPALTPPLGQPAAPSGIDAHGARQGLGVGGGQNRALSHVALGRLDQPLAIGGRDLEKQTAGRCAHREQPAVGVGAGPQGNRATGY